MYGRAAVRLLLLSVAIVALQVPSSAATPAATDPVTVKMIEFTFNPPTLTIPAGTTVTWTYNESASDPVPNCETAALQLGLPVSCPGHSTTSSTLGPDGQPLWDSGVHRADGFPYSHTFTEPGTYPYYCVVHGGASPNNPLTHMDGTIVVTAAAAGTGDASTDVGAGAGGTDVAAAGSPSVAPSTSARLPATGAESVVALGLALFVAGLALRRAVKAPPAY